MEAMGQCPPALFDKLTVNELMPDEATDRQGNCGIDAFARSLMAQLKDDRVAGSSASATNRRNLKKSVDKLCRVGVSWLEVNASETIWPGMTVAKLCCTVSGWSFQEYLAKMRQDREWVDTAFLHALGRAYGVNVVVLDMPCRAFGCVRTFAAVHSAVVCSHRSHRQNCIVRSVRIKLGQATAEMRFTIFVCERALGAWLLEPLWCFMCVRETALAVCSRSLLRWSSSKPTPTKHGWVRICQNLMRVERPFRYRWPWSMITTSGGSCHAQTRLQLIPSTRASTRRCGGNGVLGLLGPVSVAKTSLVTAMASMMGSLHQYHSQLPVPR